MRALPSWLPRYGIAVAATLVALLVRLQLGPQVEPSLLFLAAVIITTWYGGLLPGLLATILGVLACTYFFLSPAYSFAITGLKLTVGLVEFVVVALAISWMDVRRAERQRVEAHRQKTFSEMLVHSSVDGILAFDRDCRYTVWNPGMERISGITRAQALGKCAFDVFPFLRESGEDRFFLTTLAGKTVIARDRPYLVPETDRKGFFEGYYSPLRNERGETVGGLAIIRDITERKRSEEAQRFLAEAARVLVSSLDFKTTLASVARLALPNIADFCIVDLVEKDKSLREVVVAHVDPAKEKLLATLRRGYPPDLGEPHPVFKVLRTGQPEIVPETSESLKTALAHDAEQLDLIRALGFNSVMVVPLVARGRTIGTISFVSAESGRRYGPADLALAEDLAHLAALAVDNAQLYDEAREAVRVRDEVLSSVSHDLKNPLGCIKGLAQLLKRQAARPEPLEGDRIVEGLANIDTIATKMASLINQLLDVARLQIGQPLVLDRRPINLVALARQVAAEHQRGTERHCIQVETAETQLTGMWDAGRLERVLGNLLSNAIKYSPEGGPITVRVAREDGESAPSAILEVLDSGVGIPAADLPRVFERFHRGENVSGSIAGTGIGLVGTRQIVEQHAGTIAVASEEGAGSRFTVRLPVGDTASPTN